MLMRSYNFNSEIDMGKVWSLFKDFAKLDGECTCSCEIVEATLKGSIPLDKLDEDENVQFDLQRYVHKFDKHRRMEQSRHYKKVKYLADNMDDTDGSRVLADAVYSLHSEDEYEKLINDSELEWALKHLDEMSLDFIILYKVDIKTTLLQANKGIPESIKLIKGIVEQYPFMGKLLHIILQCGKPLEEVLTQGY